MVHTANVKQIHKDLCTLLKNLESTFAGEVQADESGMDWDNLKLNFEITPRDGIYNKCRIKFYLNLTGYPELAPAAHVVDTVYHPNMPYDNMHIDAEICLNILEYDIWKTVECKDLETVIQGVLFLFYEPNIDDALAYGGDDLQELAEMVDLTKFGTLMDGIVFSKIFDVPEEETTSVREDTKNVEDDEVDADDLVVNKLEQAWQSLVLVDDVQKL